MGAFPLGRVVDRTVRQHQAAQDEDCPSRLFPVVLLPVERRPEKGHRVLAVAPCLFTHGIPGARGDSGLCRRRFLGRRRRIFDEIRLLSGCREGRRQGQEENKDEEKEPAGE
jgi:hypothetical protein